MKLRESEMSADRSDERQLAIAVFLNDVVGTKTLQRRWITEMAAMQRRNIISISDSFFSKYPFNSVV